MSGVDPKQRGVYPFWIRDTIRYSDLDPNDHVNNGAINSFFEDGRVRLRGERLAGVEPDVLRGFVLVRYLIEYHAQLGFPGEVEIGTGIARIGRSSYTLGQGVFQGETCVATAEVVTVRLDPDTGRSDLLPDDLRAVLGELALVA